MTELSKNSSLRSHPDSNSHRTFDIHEAARFLGAHTETIRRLAFRGEIPGVKIGRKWIFIEQDLVMYIRNKYSICDASQGVNMRSIELWHSTNEMASGGLTSSIRESVYAKVLGLK
ncbi:MAG: helix-turn-helix domain-containing protein [bacterium]|nr:helix-turn-helix domain-containing protein [bacterium]